jgi:hypothetical protein
VKVSKGNKDCLSKKLSIEGTVGDAYSGKYVFVVSALIGDADINCLPFLMTPGGRGMAASSTYQLMCC